MCPIVALGQAQPPRRVSRLSNLIGTSPYVVPAALGALVLGLRLLFIGELPPAVNYDEAIPALVALELGRGVPFSPYVPVNTVFEAAWPVLLAPLFVLFGPTTLLLRAASVLVSSLGVLILVLAAWRAMGGRTWLAAGILFAALPWFLTFSRSAYGEILLLPAMGLALSGLWWIIHSHRWQSAFFGGILAAMPVYVYTPGRAVALCLVVYVGALAVLGIVRKRTLPLYLAGFIQGLVPLLHWLLLDNSHRYYFFFANLRARALWDDGLALDDIPAYLIHLWREISGLFWNQSVAEFAPDGPLLPWYVALGLLLAATRTVLLVRRRDGYGLAMVGILWFIGLAVIAGAGLFRGRFSPMHLMPAAIPLVLLAAWGLAWLLERRPWGMPILAGLAILGASHSYFWYGLAERGFDSGYQTSLDRVADALASSASDAPILVMNGAYEPAISWRLAARGDWPRYALVDINRLLGSRAQTLPEGLTALQIKRGHTDECGRVLISVNDCQVNDPAGSESALYFASEAVAFQVQQRYPRSIEGAGVGPYRLINVGLAP